MKERKASVERSTAETRIELELNLDGVGECDRQLGLGFLEHMFDLLARHAAIDLKITARGDLEVDEHHLVEDLGIVLGEALAQALGDKRGIERYGFALTPMDDVLVASAVDLGGRSSFCCDYRPKRPVVGDLPTELVPHFFKSLADSAGCNLHFRFLNRGENEHHRVEAMFKSFARALKMAVGLDPGSGVRIPSTKGVL